MTLEELAAEYRHIRTKQRALDGLAKERGDQYKRDLTALERAFRQDALAQTLAAAELRRHRNAIVAAINAQLEGQP